MGPRSKLAALAAAFAVVAAASVPVVGIFGPQDPPLPVNLHPPTPPPPLDRVIPEVRLDSMELSDLFDEVGRLAGVEIDVDWDSIRKGVPGAHLRPRASVHTELRLRDVTLGQVLAKVFACVDDEGDLIALPAGPSRVRILYRFCPEASPPEEPVVRHYDVRRLLAALDRQPYSYSSGGCFGAAPPPSPNTPAELDVIHLVYECAPDFHHEYDVFAGRLVVVQTPANHRRIEQMLRQLEDLWPEDPK